MSKAQTDIRSTSYDARYANPFGYEGTIDDALVQIRAELNPRTHFAPGAVQRGMRAELLRYLGVDRRPGSAGPSVEMDESPRYGEEPSTEPGFYSLDYAVKHWPETFRS